ncbi:protease pro-enzyme activation domain-containing protein, partial [Mycobacterium sp.]|uniref:protease pro-enzyme activation domain-containing protein n=1 Tax=Mycobacterium sp. TaxID=1785 RepID=UPI003C729415
MAAKSKGPAIPEGYKRLSGSERPRPSASRYLGPVDASEQISATLILRQKPGSPALPGHEHWDNTPPGQRQFLSPQQYAETYGASPADIDAVTAFVSSHGLRILEAHPGRRTISISGSASQVNGAFGIQLNRYQTPRLEYRSR